MATLANPSLSSGNRGRGKTAFERNLLPGFAEWILEQIEQREPDYLIPVETKGARVFEVVQRYAREELFKSIDIPVIYGPALAYIDPAVLRDSRVMIVDDAVRTGTNLNRHRTKVERYGTSVVQAVACIGDADDAHPKADCYLSVGADLYREYIWQLAELVVARGLPPEVDHHLFEVRLPGRFYGAWGELVEVLSRYGTLTIDGPASRSEELQPVTLHFPALPGVVTRPGAGTPDEGPSKLRFFPDASSDCVYVVPVSFPALSLRQPEGATPGSDPESRRYGSADAIGRVRHAVGLAGTVGERLVEAARVLDPGTIFAAATASMEVELMRGLARVLAREMPGCSIRAQHESFDRLYGPPVADGIAADVTRLVGSECETQAVARRGGATEVPIAPAPHLDAQVAAKTRAIAEHLKRMYVERAREPEYDIAERVGLSMGEIVAAFPDLDPLLVSRCVDFGLAMTTLVPYIEVERLPDGTIKVQRRYRVSEPGRDDNRPYADISEVRVGLSAETTAAICHCVAKHSTRYGGDPIPRDLLASLVAILRPLVCDDHSIDLKALSGADGWEVILCEDDRPVTLGEETSPMFVLGAGGVAPTEKFRERWDGDDLSLDVRKTSEEIEAHILELIPFLDELELEDHHRLLEGWAMSTDRRLGLTHVRRSLDSAIADSRRLLNRILRAEPHAAETAAARAMRPDYITAAREKIELLSSDWAAPARERWPTPTKRQRRALASLGAATAPGGVYALPTELVELMARLAPLAQRLDEVSAEAWNGVEDRVAETVGSALEVSARVHRVLTSFADDYETLVAPEGSRAAIELAATELLDVIRLVKAFVAATASAYRGPQNAHLQPPDEDRRMASVLSLDLAGSSQHARANKRRIDHEWKNGGLNLAAQWARAFLGREGKGREGDDIWIEFPVGDPGVLCAAAVQQHVAALSSTGIDDLQWSFHAAVDSGELETGDGGNTMATCMNRVTKLAKLCDEDGETDHVFVTANAWEACSAGLRVTDLSARWEEVQLGEAGDGGELLRPWAVDSAAVMAKFCERLGALAPFVAEHTSALGEVDGPLRIEDEGGEGEGGEDEEEPPTAAAAGGQ